MFFYTCILRKNNNACCNFKIGSKAIKKEDKSRNFDPVSKSHRIFISKFSVIKKNESLKFEHNASNSAYWCSKIDLPQVLVCKHVVSWLWFVRKVFHYLGYQKFCGCSEDVCF